MASRATEIGDAKTVALCDAVLIGQADAEELIDLVELDDDWHAWMLRGNNLGWRTRAP